MLHRPADPERDVELRGDRDARLPDLVRLRHIAGIDGRARSADGRAEDVGELLDGVARETPVQNLRSLSESVGGPVVLKCENLQRTGSFKIRGAYTRMSRLPEAERARGVVAASATTGSPWKRTRSAASTG